MVRSRWRPTRDCCFGMCLTSIAVQIVVMYLIQELGKYTIELGQQAKVIASQKVQIIALQEMVKKNEKREVSQHNRELDLLEEIRKLNQNIEDQKKELERLSTLSGYAPLKYSNSCDTLIYSAQLLNSFDSLDDHSKPSMESPHAYFDRIFVLNLHSRKARWKRTKIRLQSVGITAERFEAISKLDDDVIAKYQQYEAAPLTNAEKLIGQKAFQSAGQFASTLSHLEIIQTAKLRGYRKILVLEDNIILHKNFSQLFVQSMAQLPPNWKLLLFGSYMHPYDVSNMVYPALVYDYRLGTYKNAMNWYVSII